MFPAADPLALDLLTKLLRFDPMQRISAAEALSHPYFDVLKTRDYINSYKAKNQHIFDDDVSLTQAATAATSISPASRILQQKQQGELALRPDPMNVDIEKVGESPENLKRNVSEPRGRRWVRAVTHRPCVCTDRAGGALLPPPRRGATGCSCRRRCRRHGADRVDRGGGRQFVRRATRRRVSVRRRSALCGARCTAARAEYICS